MIEELKRNTFNKMCQRGEIATNSDNEKWVSDLIQIGYDYCQQEYEEKLRWIPVEEFEFKIKSPENPDIIIFKEDNRYSVLEITDLYSINYAKNNYSHCRYFL